MKTDDLMIALKASKAKIIFIFGPIASGKTWTVNKYCELMKYKPVYITRYQAQENALREYMGYKNVISLYPQNYDYRFRDFAMKNGFADVLIFDEYYLTSPLCDEFDRMASLTKYLATDDTKLILIENSRCYRGDNFYLGLVEQSGIYYEVYEL